MKNIEELSVNTIRVLSAEAIQKAKSGHPDCRLAAAPMAYELWTNHMNHNPADPGWAKQRSFCTLRRTRLDAVIFFITFVWLRKSFYGRLKDFRQLGSLTPGHPEYGHTVGIEARQARLDRVWQWQSAWQWQKHILPLYLTKTVTIL